MTNVPQLPHADRHNKGNGQGRPWSIGSEVLGHYGDNSTAEHNQASHDANRYSSNQTDGIIDVYDGTGQTAKEGGDPDMEGGKPQFLRTSTNAFNRVIADWWWWELLSWLVSALCVGAIVVVLALYNEQPLPHWPLGITLNAYISILAGLAKAALMLPVAEAIGQLKWVWFRRKSKLLDFFTFDSASRGPWGCLMLLGSTKCRHLVSLGAVITISALAFETFFQQIVSYPERPIVLGNGSISTAISYHVDVDPQQPSLENDLAMGAAISSTVLGSNDTVPSAPPSCGTNNCTWGQYSSLGVCTQCKDISSFVRYICKNHTLISFTSGSSTDYGCGYTLNGTMLTGTYLNGLLSRRVVTLTLQAVDVPSNISSDRGPFTSSIAFKDFVYPIFDFYIAYAPEGKVAVLRNDTPVAMECVFHWCTKSYQASYFEGALNETIVDTFANQSAKELSSSEILAGIPPIVITPPFGSTTFSVSNGTTEGLKHTFSLGLSHRSIETDDNLNITDSFLGIFNVTMAPPYDFNAYLDLITTSMTNNLRTKIQGTEPVIGPAWGKQTFVRIRWVWISLPVFLLLATLAFVVGTIVKSSRQRVGIWKTSALAMLLHGLAGGARYKLDPEASASEVEAAARKIHVTLSPDKDTSRLVLF